MIAIGFTGTQQGMTINQAVNLSDIVSQIDDDIVFHHGDCIGADKEALDIFRANALNLIKTHSHPPLNPSKRAFTQNDYTSEEKEYLIRNHDIVDACSLLIACPSTEHEVLRSGTWATIRYAKNLNKPRIILYPDRRIEYKDKFVLMAQDFIGLI